MRWPVLVISLVAGCGRVGFKQPKADAATSSVDAAADGALPVACMPLAGGETIQQCLDAFASPATATDQLVYDCGRSCLWGTCMIIDPCMGCACSFYVKSSSVCDVNGFCGPPINGNGCLGGGFNTTTWGCPSNGIVVESACMLRAYQQVGACM